MSAKSRSELSLSTENHGLCASCTLAVDCCCLPRSMTISEIEKRQWACQSEDFIASVASVFQQAFAELSLMKAACPTLMRQEEGAQPGAAPIDTLRAGCVHAGAVNAVMWRW